MSYLAATLILQAAFLTSAPNTSAPSTSSLKYRDAYAEAQDSKRPLMIVLGADWCQACVDLKQSTIPEMQKLGKLDGVVLTFVNIDEEPELARQLLGGPSIPQVILFSKGESGSWVRKQLTGRQSSDSLASLIAPTVTVAKTPATSTK